MILKLKKLCVSLLTMLSIFTAFLGFISPTLSVYANSTISFTFNHTLADNTLMTNQNILDTINNNSFMNGVAVDLASSISSLRVYAKVSGTSRYIELAEASNNPSEIIITFNLNYQFFKQITFSADRATGNGSMEIYINNSETLSNSFNETSNSGFMNYTVNSANPIQVIRFKPTSGQNNWYVGGITFTSVDLAELSAKVESYTLEGCATDATITKQLSTSEVQQLNDLYTSMSTAEKDSLKTNYPTAWGRMKWMFDKKNLSY